jgi:hypothetical protein
MAGKQPANQETKKMNENLVSLRRLRPEKRWWSWRPLAPLLILCVAKIKSWPLQQMLLSWSAQHSPNKHGQQESTEPARDGQRQERHQNDPSHAYLSSNSVHLTTQAWLLDCNPRD